MRGYTIDQGHEFLWMYVHGKWNTRTQANKDPHRTSWTLLTLHAKEAFDSINGLASVGEH